jgi:DNA-binding NarL/FixJ family response regulator
MTVLIAAEHTIIRESLALLLASEGLEVVGLAASGTEAIRLAERRRPDVVLLESLWPDSSGLTLIRELRARCPRTAAVILTDGKDETEIHRALAAGARGSLLKSLDGKTVARLLAVAAAETRALAPGTSSTLPLPCDPSDPDALTDREQDVARLLASGTTSNRGLADALGVSVNTVKFHLRNILEKMHLHSRATLVCELLRPDLAPRDRAPRLSGAAAAPGPGDDRAPRPSGAHRWTDAPDGFEPHRAGRLPTETRSEPRLARLQTSRPRACALRQ